MTTIPGYAYGSSQLPHSPITLAEFELLKQSVLLTDDDLTALRMSRPILEPQVEAILDVWYGFVGSTPHLLKYFENVPRGVPDGDYLAAVRKRFGRWILDTAAGNYDQSWLDYQHEIGLRHHTTKKNRTDNVQSQPIIHLRYLVALVYPITATLKPFLEKGDHDAAQVDRMHQAWIKSVLLQVILWSYPYVRDGEF
ncbi:MAG: protoglobin domain-containing protein [bacterium]|nr:protoglobin domain-containing protein [bacterium]